MDTDPSQTSLPRDGELTLGSDFRAGRHFLMAQYPGKVVKDINGIINSFRGPKIPIDSVKQKEDAMKQYLDDISAKYGIYYADFRYDIIVHPQSGHNTTVCIQELMTGSNQLLQLVEARDPEALEAGVMLTSKLLDHLVHVMKGGGKIMTELYGYDQFVLCDASSERRTLSERTVLVDVEPEEIDDIKAPIERTSAKDYENILWCLELCAEQVLMVQESEHGDYLRRYLLSVVKSLPDIVKEPKEHLVKLIESGDMSMLESSVVDMIWGMRG